MSLATDILKRLNKAEPPKSAEPEVQQVAPAPLSEKPDTIAAGPTRSYNRDEMSIANARLRAAGKPRRVVYSKPTDKLFGVRLMRRSGLYSARPRINGVETCLGEFAKPERAGIAARLYYLWHSRGFTDIPRGISCGYIDFARFDPFP